MSTRYQKKEKKKLEPLNHGSSGLWYDVILYYIMWYDYDFVCVSVWALIRAGPSDLFGACVVFLCVSAHLCSVVFSLLLYSHLCVCCILFFYVQFNFVCWCSHLSGSLQWIWNVVSFHFFHQNQQQKYNTKDQKWTKQNRKTFIMAQRQKFQSRLQFYVVSICWFQCDFSVCLRVWPHWSFPCWVSEWGPEFLCEVLMTNSDNDTRPILSGHGIRARTLRLADSSSCAEIIHLNLNANGIIIIIILLSFNWPLLHVNVGANLEISFCFFIPKWWRFLRWQISFAFYCTCILNQISEWCGSFMICFVSFRFGLFVGHRVGVRPASRSVELSRLTAIIIIT